LAWRADSRDGRWFCASNALLTLRFMLDSGVLHTL
jgi:hypothetical protein